MFTRDQMETIWARRQNERRQLLDDAKAAIMGDLKPTLDEMTAEIGNANHVKRELGDKIDALTASVTSSNIALTAHTQLAAHPVGQQLVADLGLVTWSLEEKRAVKPMVEDYIATRRRRADDERKTRRRQAFLLAVGSVGAAVAGILGGLIARFA